MCHAQNNTFGVLNGMVGAQNNVFHIHDVTRRAQQTTFGALTGAFGA
jgi:hypothetical protein